MHRWLVQQRPLLRVVWLPQMLLRLTPGLQALALVLRLMSSLLRRWRCTIRSVLWTLTVDRGRIFSTPSPTPPSPCVSAEVRASTCKLTDQLPTQVPEVPLQLPQRAQGTAAPTSLRHCWPHIPLAPTQLPLDPLDPPLPVVPFERLQGRQNNPQQAILYPRRRAVAPTHCPTSC